MGYGNIPAETIKVLNPKSIVTNLFAIKLQVTRAAINKEVKMINKPNSEFLFSWDIIILIFSFC